jgi:hypothetical protein
MSCEAARKSDGNQSELQGKPQTLDQAMAAFIELAQDEPKKSLLAIGKQLMKQLADAWQRRRHDGVPTRPEAEAAPKKRKGSRSKGKGKVITTLPVLGDVVMMEC